MKRIAPKCLRGGMRGELLARETGGIRFAVVQRLGAAAGRVQTMSFAPGII